MSFFRNNNTNTNQEFDDFFNVSYQVEKKHDNYVKKISEDEILLKDKENKFWNITRNYQRFSGLLMPGGVNVSYQWRTVSNENTKKQFNSEIIMYQNKPRSSI